MGKKIASLRLEAHGEACTVQDALPVTLGVLRQFSALLHETARMVASRLSFYVVDLAVRTEAARDGRRDPDRIACSAFFVVPDHRPCGAFSGMSMSALQGRVCFCDVCVRVNAVSRAVYKYETRPVVHDLASRHTVTGRTVAVV